MSPLTSIDGLSEAAAWAEEVASTLSSGRTVVLDGAADANVMLGLVQLEAALLDRGLPYRRALSPSTHVLPASERASIVVGDSELHCSVVEEADAHPSFPDVDGSVHRFVPVAASVELGRDQRPRTGTLSPAVLCALVAEHLAPGGSRVRRVRPWVLLAQWGRGALDATYDPWYTVLRDHLCEEGSIRVASLADVETLPSTLPEGFSHALLKRLRRAWPKMDHSARSRGFSEAVLPALRHASMASARLEEVVWHRPVLPGQALDMLEQAALLGRAAGADRDDGQLSMSRKMDALLTTGALVGSV